MVIIHISEKRYFYHIWKHPLKSIIMKSILATTTHYSETSHSSGQI